MSQKLGYLRGGKLNFILFLNWSMIARLKLCLTASAVLGRGQLIRGGVIIASRTQVAKMDEGAFE